MVGEPATLCIHAPLFLLPVQVGEWEVETPAQAGWGIRSMLSPTTAAGGSLGQIWPWKRLFLIKTLWLIFSSFHLWVCGCFRTALSPPSKTLKILGYFNSSQSVVHPIKA